MSESVAQLQEFFSRHPRWLVLTGAGISARSGIPTYRDASGKWLRNQPIQHQEFLQQPEKRRRYWGRSMVGWPGVRDARPNEVHLALTRLEQQGRVELLVTQNVDRLHQRAGAQQVVDLHGRLDRVICLDCGAGYYRDYVQQHLERLNPDHQGFHAQARPDGDADLSEEQVAGIRVFDCEACGGTLMPDVVFFGGSIPRVRVDHCEQALIAADGLLVIGSSLQVYSGFRFCRQAHQQGKPIVIVNEGTTRADELASLKVELQAMDALMQCIDTLSDLSTVSTQETSCHAPSSSGSATTSA